MFVVFDLLVLSAAISATSPGMANATGRYDGAIVDDYVPSYAFAIHGLVLVRWVADDDDNDDDDDYYYY